MRPERLKPGTVTEAARPTDQPERMTGRMTAPVASRGVSVRSSGPMVTVFRASEAALDEGITAIPESVRYASEPQSVRMRETASAARQKKDWARG